MCDFEGNTIWNHSSLGRIQPTDGDKDTAVHYSENETCLPAMAMAAVPRCGFAGESAGPELQHGEICKTTARQPAIRR